MRRVFGFILLVVILRKCCLAKVYNFSSTSCDGYNGTIDECTTVLVWNQKFPVNSTLAKCQTNSSIFHYRTRELVVGQDDVYYLEIAPLILGFLNPNNITKGCLMLNGTYNYSLTAYVGVGYLPNSSNHYAVVSDVRIFDFKYKHFPLAETTFAPGFMFYYLFDAKWKGYWKKILLPVGKNVYYIRVELNGGESAESGDECVVSYALHTCLHNDIAHKVMFGVGLGFCGVLVVVCFPVCIGSFVFCFQYEKKIRKRVACEKKVNDEE